jgi:hypothetical protein
MAPVSAMHNQQQAPSPIKAASTLDGAAMTDTTLDCSFESAGEGESLTITFLQLELDEEQQGLETPLTGSNFWSAKSNSQAPMTAPAPVTPMQESQRANDKTYPAATFKLVDVHATHVPPLVDPDDCECIEATENGVLQDTQQNEEGFEMNLSDYEETNRFILLDLQGAEVATTGKRVRFEIDGEDDLSVKATTTSRNRRKQIVKFLRSKSKKEDSIVGSPQVSQLALESGVKPSILKESSYPISGRERVNQQANKFTGVVIEIYDCVLKAVTETYLLCQYTGSYLEEKVLDMADTQCLRELLDDATVDLLEDANGGAKGAITKKDMDEHDLNLAETFSFEVLIPYDEARENKPVVVKDTDRRTAYM